MATQKIEALIQGGDEEIAIGDNIAIDFIFSTDNGSTISFLEFQSYFNSNELQFNSISLNPAAGGAPLTQENIDDTTDGDANPDTDRLIRYAALDVNSSFPASQPIDLYTANFTVLQGFDGNTSINLAGSSDGVFLGVPLDLTADLPVRIVTGQRIRNVRVEKNAADTVIDLLPIFEDPDGDPISYTVENTSPSLVNTRIEGTNLILDYQEGGIGRAEITINAFAGGTDEDLDFIVNVVEPPPVAVNFNLDADASNSVSFLRDGLLISSFLFNYTPERTDYSALDGLILNPSATRTAGNDVANYLKGGLTQLDVDGDGQTSFTTDGLLINAFLFSYDSARTDYSSLDRFITSPSATRTTGNDVANYLKTLLPSTSTSFNDYGAGKKSSTQTVEVKIQGDDTVVSIGENIAIDFIFSTNDGSKVASLDFQALFNSNELQFNSISLNSIVGDSPLTEENLNDPNDLDGATDTNTAIRYGALDINTTFPNGTLPTILYTANFTVKDGFDGNTSINLVGAADGQFLGVPLTLNLAPIVPDEDTPPVVAAPLSDILVNENDDNTTIDLLPVFSDVDGDAIAYSITSSDESRIVATIEGTNAILDYQPEQFGEDITITVTAEANGKAVSDDFLVDITTTIVDEPEEPPAPEIATLDIDGSGEVTFARDGLLASALLFFYRDDRTDYSILDRFITDPNATLKTGNEIVDLYKNNLSIFDVDGNGEVTFARDGLLVSAFLFFNRPDRTDFSVLDRFITAPDAVRKTGAEVATYLQGLLPIFINAALDSDSGNSIEPSNFIGTDGKDILTGNATNKIFFGGAGDNLLTGSANKDSFQFVANSGDYRVQDLKIGEDLIEIDSVLGFSNSSEVLAAITTKNIADNLFPSELDLEANGTVEILHDRALTADNFVVT